MWEGSFAHLTSFDWHFWKGLKAWSWSYYESSLFGPRKLILFCKIESHVRVQRRDQSLILDVCLPVSQAWGPWKMVRNQGLWGRDSKKQSKHQLWGKIFDAKSIRKRRIEAPLRCACGEINFTLILESIPLHWSWRIDRGGAWTVRRKFKDELQCHLVVKCCKAVLEQLDRAIHFYREQMKKKTFYQPSRLHL